MGTTRMATTITSVDQPRSMIMALPRYLEVADDLRRRIADGEFPPGAQLPTRRQLCEEYGVSEITVDAAMRELRRDGQLVTVHGRGVFVKQP